MKYFRMLDDIRFSGRWYLRDPETDTGLDPSELTSGVPYLGAIRPRVRLRSGGTALDLTLTDFAVPIASDRFCEASGGVADSTVQRIPVNIDSMSGYEIINPTRTIA